ncbi:MAG: hypothetical protein KIH69_003220 [Anaerolineae bacterium]|nr:hypothetical protein [Anaerolineae bacterium]
MFELIRTNIYESGYKWYSDKLNVIAVDEIAQYIPEPKVRKNNSSLKIAYSIAHVKQNWIVILQLFFPKLKDQYGRDGIQLTLIKIYNSRTPLHQLNEYLQSLIKTIESPDIIERLEHSIALIATSSLSKLELQTKIEFINQLSSSSSDIVSEIKVENILLKAQNILKNLRNVDPDYERLKTYLSNKSLIETIPIVLSFISKNLAISVAVGDLDLSQKRSIKYLFSIPYTMPLPTVVLPPEIPTENDISVARPNLSNEKPSFEDEDALKASFKSTSLSQDNKAEVVSKANDLPNKNDDQPVLGEERALTANSNLSSVSQNNNVGMISTRDNLVTEPIKNNEKTLKESRDLSQSVQNNKANIVKPNRPATQPNQSKNKSFAEDKEKIKDNRKAASSKEDKNNNNFFYGKWVNILLLALPLSCLLLSSWFIFPYCCSPLQPPIIDTPPVVTVFVTPEMSRVVPLTRSLIPPTAVTIPPTAVTIPPTAVTIPPTAVTIPPTAVAIPPTAVTIPPTAVVIPPTAVTILQAVVATPPICKIISIDDLPEGYEACDNPEKISQLAAYSGELYPDKTIVKPYLYFMVFVAFPEKKIFSCIYTSSGGVVDFYQHRRPDKIIILVPKPDSLNNKNKNFPCPKS